MSTLNSILICPVVSIVDKIWLSKDVYEESKMAPDSGDDALRGGDMEKIFKPNIEANPKGKEPYNGNEWVYFVKTLFSLVPYIFVTWLFILLVSARRENELLKARVQLAKFRLERLIRYFTRQQTAPPPD